MRLRLLTFLMCLSVSLVANGEELTQQKQDDIRRLLAVTGTTKLALQMADASVRSISDVIRKARPDIPSRLYPILRRELANLFSENIEAPNGFVDRVIPAYHKYLSHSEIQELLAFYETPLGLKTIQVMPAVTAESMAIGRAWGESLGPEIDRRVGQALAREGITMPAR